VVKTGPSFLQFFENGCGSRAGEAAVAVAAGSGSGGKCDRQQAHWESIETDVDFAEAGKILNLRSIPKGMRDLI